MLQLIVNGEAREVDVDPETPHYGSFEKTLISLGPNLVVVPLSVVLVRCILTVSQCDLVLPVIAVNGAEITTIEGIANDDGMHPVQQAWIAEQVPQCGYCQSGQIMSAVALLENSPNPTDDEIDKAMTGNICRCGMYSRIRSAIKRVADSGVQIFDPASQEVQNG